MPFKSEAQRRYMWAKLPRIARRWQEEYGNPEKKRKRKTPSRRRFLSETAEGYRGQ